MAPALAILQAILLSILSLVWRSLASFDALEQGLWTIGAYFWTVRMLWECTDDLSTTKCVVLYSCSAACIYLIFRCGSGEQNIDFHSFNVISPMLGGGNTVLAVFIYIPGTGWNNSALGACMPWTEIPEYWHKYTCIQWVAPNWKCPKSVIGLGGSWILKCTSMRICVLNGL